jgi:hypothetical protein
MLRVANGIIESKNTKETDNDRLKQSSRMNFLDDIKNSLWPKKLSRKAGSLFTSMDVCLYHLAGCPKKVRLSSTQVCKLGLQIFTHIFA